MCFTIDPGRWKFIFSRSSRPIMNRVYIKTYGCQMNVADSELVEGILTNLGLEKTTDYDEADAIFLNEASILPIIS